MLAPMVALLQRPVGSMALWLARCPWPPCLALPAGSLKMAGIMLLPTLAARWNLPYTPWVLPSAV